MIYTFKVIDRISNVTLAILNIAALNFAEAERIADGIIEFPRCKVEQMK